MTGIEKIVKQIEDNAAAAAKALLDEAKSKAEQIIAEAKAEAEKKSADILQKSAKDVSSAISRAESAARLKEKRIILDAKQKIIDEIISKAKAAVIGLTDKEYFELIEKMIARYASSGQGQILFSPEDRKRLPAQFEAAVSRALSGKNGAVLVISEETRNIDGGFILVYGDIEENCSFEALFSAARDMLQDKVSSFLFE